MTLEAGSEGQALVTRSAVSSIGVAVVSGLAARVLEEAVGSNVVVLATIAVGLGAGLWMHLRATAREAKRQVPQALVEVAQSHELSFRPWTVALSGLFMILTAEFATGFLFGLVLAFGFSWEGVTSGLEVLGASEADIGSIIGVAAVYTGLLVVMAVTAFVAIYMSHRIRDNEIWWIFGTVIVARLASAAMGVAIFGGFPPWWVIPAFTVAAAVPALLGHLRAQATRDRFTLGYLGALLGEEDRKALMDLVVELTPAETRRDEI